MKRLAIVGVDTFVGSSAMIYFDGTREVSGVQLTEQTAVSDLCRSCSDMIVCGDASLSSWDEAFGCFQRDRKLIPAYCRMASEAGVRVVYISSDAIFGGPWVFHDDHSPQIRDAPVARQLQSIEQIVLKNSRNLVIRTNAIADVSGSWLNQLRQSFQAKIPQRLLANQFATPLAASRFSLLLDHILQTDAAGVVHLAGAERLSPWNFATQLARAESVSVQCVAPFIAQEPREQSLRCSRARQEFRLRMPTLSQTITELTMSPASSRRVA
ncbi:MAG: sugar nucleotide-binding protein [Fuerstiella sp.]|nr:sugar nucleotide-binding protein [Fuerstiella sp.]